MKRDLPSIYRRELVDLIFEQPYCRIENIVTAGLAKRQTAAVWLKALSSAGFLNEVQIGRNKVFIDHEFLAVLTKRG